MIIKFLNHLFFYEIILVLSVLLQSGRFLAVQGVNPNLILIFFILLIFNQKSLRIIFLLILSLIILTYFFFYFFLIEIIIFSFLVAFAALARYYLTGSRFLDLIIAFVSLDVFFYIILVFSNISFLMNYGYLIVFEIIYDIILIVFFYFIFMNSSRINI